MILIGAILVLVVMLVILVLLSRAMYQLRVGAKRLAEGKLSQRLEVSGPLNVAMVAESLNTMAALLEERLQTVVDQRNEFSAVVTNMAEGVLTFDHQERLTSINPSGCRLLGIDAANSLGRSVQEVIRSTALNQLVHDVLHDGSPRTAEVQLRNTTEINDQSHSYFEVQAAPLTRGDEAGGVLLVIHDITTLRHLEQVRRDFVANVSHELKTPVAAIKAAIETLEELEPDEADAAERFQRIIHRNSARLEAIIEDLLTLAKLEQHGGPGSIEMTPAALLPILQSAIELCQSAATEKSMSIQLLCDADLTVQCHTALLERAVVNLLDNAVKYCPPECEIVVSATRSGKTVDVAVKDDGPGINPKEQHRLFERFYRADKARSRHLGGTGLGLSIVKHIAEAHGGHASVESRIGIGSKFLIQLPAYEPEMTSL